LDEHDNLCVTDTGTRTVSYYDRTRKKSRCWSEVGGIRFGLPVAVAKRNECFYVADTALGQVVVFNEAGKVLRRITNHLERPAGLAVVKEQLCVADSQRHAVVTFDLSGNYRSEFGRRGKGP